MSTAPDNEVPCIIFDGPPIDQITASSPQDKVRDHTFYYRMEDEPNDVRRMIHVLYYHTVVSLPSGGVMTTVVTTNHNPVPVSYTASGNGTFLARKSLVGNRRL